jgi:hypothetical protein
MHVSSCPRPPSVVRLACISPLFLLCVVAPSALLLFYCAPVSVGYAFAFPANFACSVYRSVAARLQWAWHDVFQNRLDVFADNISTQIALSRIVVLVFQHSLVLSSFLSWLIVLVLLSTESLCGLALPFWRMFPLCLMNVPPVVACSPPLCMSKRLKAI